MFIEAWQTWIVNFLTVRFFYPVCQTPYIIRCKTNRFLYYLSVYVKSFKELFLMSPRENAFLKSECKSTNNFPTHQIFQGKSSYFNSILTEQHIFRAKHRAFRSFFAMFSYHGDPIVFHLNLLVKILSLLIVEQSIVKRKSPDYFRNRGSLLKGGGYLLSRIALQYHRRKWA